MAGSNGNGTTVSTKQLWAAVAAGIASIGALLAVHGALVVPSILFAAKQEMQKEIDRHEVRVHPNGVHRREFDEVMVQLSKIESEMASRESLQNVMTHISLIRDTQDQIVERLDRLEDGK